MRTAGTGGTSRLRITRSLTVPLDEVTWRATTSGGPGGQHANRSATRVEVRFDASASPSLGPRQRARILQRLGPVVRASAAEHRSQWRNRQVAVDRLAEQLRAALQVERPRRPTAPSAGARQRRLDAKHRRGQTKEQRRRVNEE